MSAWQLALIVAAGFAAGCVNSIAGGGTLISFPALVAIGLNPITANVTSTLALWPGYVAGAVGFRGNLAGTRRLFLLLAGPSLVGGAVGAFLLLQTPTRTFSAIVPFLVLGAAILLALQDRTPHLQAHALRGWWVAVAVGFQFVAAVYGGYFGAGLGFMLLVGFGFMGLRDLLQMSGLKNALTVIINGVACVWFAVSGAVRWVEAAVMAGGAIAGGLTGARLARRVGGERVRPIVVVIGVAMSVFLLVKAL